MIESKSILLIPILLKDRFAVYPVDNLKKRNDHNFHAVWISYAISTL